MIAVEDFSRVVQAIYAAAMQPDDWGVALDEIASAVGSRIAAILTSDRDLNELKVRSVDLDPGSFIAYNDYYGRLDHAPPALQRVRTGAVATQQQLVARDVWERGEFFNEWAGPNDYGDGVFSVLTRHGVRTSWLCVAATPTRPPFGTPERVALVGALVPHLQQAIRTESQLSDLDRRHRDFVSAVDLMSDGIAIVGGNAQVIHLNPAARAIVNSADGLAVRSGYLTATVGRTDAALGQTVRQAFARGQGTIAKGGCIGIPRLSGRRSYELRVVPLHPDGVVGVSAPTVLVVIVDPEHQPQPEPESLRHLYGLTRNEAEVALRVLDGMGLAPIAEELSMSLSTVRTHLQHVFDKTNTHRQAELVRLLLRGLAATGHSGPPANGPRRES